MVVSITCTNQFGIEALTNPQKDISFRLFLLQSKKKITQNLPKNIILLDPSEMVFYLSTRPTGTEERYLLITWFCHPCDTMHAEVPPDDPEHFCPFWDSDRLASWFALKKKNVFRLDRLLGREQRGLGDVCCLEFCF